MFNNYVLGETLHDLTSRIITLETLIGGGSEKPIITAQLNVKNNMTIEYLNAGELLFAHAGGVVSNIKLSSLVDNTAHQTTIINNGDGSITVGTVQDIDTVSNPTFNNETLTGKIKVGGTMQIVPTSYTTSPTYKFEMMGSTTAETIMSNRRSDNSPVSPAIILQKSRGTLNNPSGVLANDLVGLLYFSGYDGTQWDDSCIIAGEATENHNLLNHGSRLKFQTVQNGTNIPTTKLLLENNGTATFYGTSESTNTSTGAVIVNGGEGIAKNLSVGGDTSIGGNVTITGNISVGGTASYPTFNVFGTIESAGIDSGALTVYGGASVRKKLYVGLNAIVGDSSPTNMYIINATTSSNSGNMFRMQSASGSAGFSLSNLGNLQISTASGATQYVELSNSQFSIKMTTSTTNTSTGALVVGGGIGCNDIHCVNLTSHSNVRTDNLEKYSSTGISVSSGTRLFINDSTNATSLTTGALIISGGLGINKSLYANTINVVNTIQSTGSTVGSLVVSGGVGIVKNLNVGGVCKFTSNVSSTDNSTGALIVGGGLGIGGSIYADYIRTSSTTSDCIFSSRTIINATNDSTSSDSGALIILGGLAVAKNTSINGNVVILSTIESTDQNTGSLVINGGVGIKKNLSVDGDLNVTGNLVYESSTITMTTNATDSLTGALQVYGGGSIRRNLFIGENLGITGIETILSTINSTSPTSGALIINGGVGINQCVNIGGTIGSSSSSTGSVIITGGVGIGDSLYVKDTINSPIYNGGYFAMTNTEESNSIQSTLDATSVSTGALKIYGGLGVSKNIYSTGLVAIQLTTNSTSLTSGSLIVDGGVGIQKNVNIGGICSIVNTSDSTNQSTGALVVNGGAGVSKTLSVGNSIKVNGSVSSSNVSSGTLIVIGGTGISENLNIGGVENITNTSEATSASSGSLVVSGGIGVKNNVIIGGTNDSTNSSTGSLTVYGGAGITKDITFQSTRSLTTEINNMSESNIHSDNLLNITSKSVTAWPLTMTWISDIGLFYVFHSVTGGISTSPDGTNWTLTPYTLPSIPYISCCYSHELRTLLVSHQNGNISYSTDFGINWNAVNVFSVGSLVNRIIWVKELSKFFAISSNSSTTRIVYSSDGITWNTPVTGLNLNSAWIDIAYSPELSILVTVAVSGTYSTAYSTDNGFNWINDKTTNPCQGICWSSELRCFVRTTTTQSLKSYNGMDWIGHTISIPQSLLVIKWIPNYHLFIGTTSFTNMYYSYDGDTWINMNVSGGTRLYDFAYSSELRVLAVTDWLTGNGHVYSNLPGYGVTKVMNTYDATSNSTGSLQVSGGVSIAKRLYVGSILGSTSTTTGSLIVDGGAAFKENLNIGGNETILSTIDASDTATGSLLIAGGVGIAKSLYSSNIYTPILANPSPTGGIYIANALRIAPGGGRCYIQPSVSSISTGTWTDLYFSLGYSSVSKYAMTSEAFNVFTTADATSTTTGSLIVTGGASIAKNLFVGSMIGASILNITGTTDTSSYTTGALQVSGGVGIKNSLFIGGTNDSSSTSTGSIIVNGGVGIAKKCYIGDGTDTTLTNNGSLVVNGGVGIKNNLYVGGKIISKATDNSTSISTGSIIVTGGIGVNGNITCQNSYVEGIIQTDTLSKRTSSSQGVIISSGSILFINDTSNATTLTSGALQVSGGEAITKSLYVGGESKFINTTDSSGTTTGSLTVTGGLGVGGKVYTGNTSVTDRALTINSSALTNYKTGIIINTCITGRSSTVANYERLQQDGVLAVYNDNVYDSSLSGNNGGSIILGGRSHDYGGGNHPMTYARIYGGEKDGFNYRGKFNFEVIDTGNMYNCMSITREGCLIGGDSTANATATLEVAGNTKINSTIDSANTTSGSLVVYGGTGIVGKLNIGGITTVLNTTVSSGSTTGALVITGGIGVSGISYFGGVTTISNATASSGSTTGALVVTGGIGISGKSYIGGITTISNATASSGSTTGALVVTGGIGIGGASVFGGITKIINSTNSTNITSGALVVTGGVGISKDVYIGSSVNVRSANTNTSINSNNATSLTTGQYTQLTIGLEDTTYNCGVLKYTHSAIDNTANKIELGIMGITGNGGLQLTGTGQVTIQSTVDTSSSTSGSIIVNGGLSVNKKIYVNDSTDSSNTTTTTTGSIITQGGLTVTKNVTMQQAYVMNTPTVDSNVVRLQDLRTLNLGYTISSTNWWQIVPTTTFSSSDYIDIVSMTPTNNWLTFGTNSSGLYDSEFKNYDSTNSPRIMIYPTLSSQISLYNNRSGTGSNITTSTASTIIGTFLNTSINTWYVNMISVYIGGTASTCSCGVYVYLDLPNTTVLWSDTVTLPKWTNNVSYATLLSLITSSFAFTIPSNHRLVLKLVPTAAVTIWGSTNTDTYATFTIDQGAGAVDKGNAELSTFIQGNTSVSGSYRMYIKSPINTLVQIFRTSNTITGLTEITTTYPYTNYIGNPLYDSQNDGKPASQYIGFVIPDGTAWYQVVPFTPYTSSGSLQIGITTPTNNVFEYSLSNGISFGHHERYVSGTSPDVIVYPAFTSFSNFVYADYIHTTMLFSPAASAVIAQTITNASGNIVYLSSFSAPIGTLSGVSGCSINVSIYDGSGTSGTLLWTETTIVGQYVSASVQPTLIKMPYPLQWNIGQTITMTFVCTAQINLLAIEKDWSFGWNASTTFNGTVPDPTFQYWGTWTGSSTVDEYIPFIRAPTGSSVTYIRSTPTVQTLLEDGNNTYPSGVYACGPIYNSNTDVNAFVYSTSGLSLTSTIDSSSTSTGSLITTGGVGIGKTLYVGNDILINNQSVSSNIAHMDTSSVYNDKALTFTVRTTGTTNSYQKITYSEQLNLYVGCTSTANTVITSSDGITWTESAMGITMNSRYAILWVPELSLFIMLATSGANFRAASSPNGLTWTARTADNTYWRGICYSKKLALIVAVGWSLSSSNTLMTSTNGITWTSSANLSKVPSWNSVCYSERLELFVAVALEGYVGYSTNGTSWTVINTSIGARVVQWADELSLFVAVGETSIGSGLGSIMTSPDGITWTQRTSPVEDMAWNDLIWIADYHMLMSVGDIAVTNNVMYSYDGINWIAITMPNIDTRKGLCYSSILHQIVIAQSSGSTGRICSTSPLAKIMIASSTIDTTSTSTGSLIVNGGASILKNLNIGGTLSNTVSWVTATITLCPSGGPIQSNTITTYFYKIGRNVTWRIPKFQVIGNSTVGYISSTTGFASIYRPNETTEFTYFCNDISGSGAHAAEIQVNTDGTIVFTADGELSFASFATTMYLFNYGLSLTWAV